MTGRARQKKKKLMDGRAMRCIPEVFLYDPFYCVFWLTVVATKNYIYIYNSQQLEKQKTKKNGIVWDAISWSWSKCRTFGRKF